MTEFGRGGRGAVRVAACMVTLGIAFTLISCGGGTANLIGLPQPLPAKTVNSYVGKIAVATSAQTDTRLWSVTIDHNANTFSYQAGSGASAGPSGKGTFFDRNGFLLLLDQRGFQLGYALEIPGRIAIVRPGNSTTAPIFSIQQQDCFPVTGNVKFLHIFVPASTSAGAATYGKIYATSNDGKAWAFDGQERYQAPLGSDPTSAYIPSYPTSLSGACSASGGSALVNVSPSAAYKVPTRYLVNPAGFFLGDQEFRSVGQLASYGNVAAFGIAESPAAVNTANVAKGSYVGFLFETNNSSYTTQLVGFGKVPSSGGVISGGTYPSEDPSLEPDTSMSINFGKQDPLNNGLFYRATLTLPIAPGANCAKPGTGERGNPTCTYNAVAMVSTVLVDPSNTVLPPNGRADPDLMESRYVIYLTSFDSGNQKVLVLLQQ